MNRRAIVAATTATGFVVGLASGNLRFALVAAVFGYFLGETGLSIVRVVQP